MGKHRSGHSYQEFPILNVARRCGLVLNDRTLEWEEVEASCPFCGDHGPGKHHLFLNTTRNIFRCVLCGEKGNSVSLYAKMEGVSNRQAFRALSEDSVLYRFPQQPLSQKPAEREPSSLAVRHNVYYDSPAINCVCESLHTLRVAAKPQSGKGRRGFGVPYYGVGVAEEADLAFGVVVGDLHQFACAHSWSVSFLCLMHKKSRSHP